MATLSATIQLFNGYSSTINKIVTGSKQAGSAILDASRQTDLYNESLEQTGDGATAATAAIGQISSGSAVMAEAAAASEQTADSLQQAAASASAYEKSMEEAADAAASVQPVESVFSPEMVNNVNEMQLRVEALQEKLIQIGANPINLQTENAQKAMERLRGQVSGILTEQDELKSAMSEMDVGRANTSYERLAQTVDETERFIRDNTDEQGRFNQKIDEGSKKASNLKDMIAGALSAFAGAKTIDMAIRFGQESFDMSNLQRGVESQLKVVLANVGATEDAFDRITQKASAIQGKTIYGDEAMIAGAGELATYISDPAAIESMMGTLANYAAGMSGGGSVDATAMTDYATQLGKALDGTYDGLKKKGFELTDAQKKIIENGTDMEKALVINDVINQSWDGLAEKMAALPENRIIQIQNKIGDMREAVGNRMTPAVMKLYDIVEKHLPTIERMLDGVGAAASVVVNIFGAIVDAGGNAADFIADNWSILQPIILGVAGAVASYLAVTGGMAAANTIVGAASGAWGVLSMAVRILAGSTAAASEAQMLYNGTLLACPITWVIGAIALLITAIYAGTAAFNKFSGESVSATGIVGGAFGVLAAFIYNNFMYPTQAGFAMLANFIGNAFHNPVAAVEVLFLDMANTCVGYIANMARAIENIINKIPGVTVDITSGLDSFQAGLETKLTTVKDESGWKEYVKAPELMDYTTAATTGYNKGKDIASKITGAWDNLTGKIGEIPEIDLSGLGSGYGSASNPSTVKGTGQGGAVKVESDEDIDWMRQLAERDYVARISQNTLAPNIRVEFSGPITKEADTDSVMTHVVDRLKDVIATAPEGVPT
jgi:hypothetical protein